MEVEKPAEHDAHPEGTDSQTRRVKTCLCLNFIKGIFNERESCSLAHMVEACQAYYTDEGCHHGKSCRFLHVPYGEDTISSNAIAINGDCSSSGTSTSAQVVEEVMDPGHPYYIAGSRGLTVSEILYGGENYLAWSVSMIIGLSVNNKIQLIDGSMDVPENTSPLFLAYTSANNVVLRWLLSSLSDEIRESVTCYVSAKDLWDGLKEIHATDDPRLSLSLNAIRRGSVSVCYNGFRGLWGEYRCCLPVVDALVRSVNGLDEPFSVIRSLLLQSSVLPSLSKIFSGLLVPEQTSESASSDPVIFSINEIGTSENFEIEVQATVLMILVTRRTTIRYLPGDVVAAILDFLPPQMFLRCQAVSKEWRMLIKDILWWGNETSSRVTTAMMMNQNDPEN